LDRWTARLRADPRLERRWRWLAPLLVSLVAGVVVGALAVIALKSTAKTPVAAVA
jgi:hypothetical protein